MMDPNTLILIQDELSERISKDFSNYKTSPKNRITAPYIETRLDVLETLWNQFFTNHYQLISSIAKSARQAVIYFFEDMYGCCQEVYLEYKVNLRTDLIKIKLEPAMCKANLPPIKLPYFSGKYEEWESFQDLFISLIHDNANLSSVQKLYYLKGCLSGEAENLLRHLPTIGANYGEAWTQLVSRFNNKRYNCNEVMKRLFAQNDLSAESAIGIKQLLDTTSACLKSLSNMEINTDTWDVMISFLVVTKLDQETRKLWESHVSQSNDIPTWNELKRFMETRFRTLEILEGGNSSVTQLNSFHSSTTEEKKNINACTMCSEQHLMYQCKQFAKQTPELRHEFVQSKGLCFNCLAPTHSVKNCRQSTCCRRCGRRHHSLLHFEKFNQNPPSSSSISLVKPEIHEKKDQLIKQSWESVRRTHHGKDNQMRNYSLYNQPCNKLYRLRS